MQIPKTRISLLVLSVFTLFARSAAQHVDMQADSIIQAYLAQNPLPGLAISVAKEGKIVWSKGYGFSDLENQIPVDPQATLFRIGSVSKPFTAAALGKLVMQGRLDLDQDLRDYVSYFPEKKYPFTVRQVAGHIAGIRHYLGMENFSSTSYKNVRHGLSIFMKDSLMFEPGTRYSYSSYGWNLLSAVVEEVSGIPFLDYMRDSVFVPMDLLHIHADENRKLIKGRGRYYIRQGNDFVNAPYVDNSYKWAGGGFLSTSNDVARFAMRHLHNEFLDEATFADFLEAQTLTDGSSTGYGVGWRSGSDDRGHQFFGHTGGSVGGTTSMFCYPEQNLVVVLITNLSNGRLGSLSRQLAWHFLEQ